jgi:hypothetical protein
VSLGISYSPLSGHWHVLAYFKFRWWPALHMHLSRVPRQIQMHCNNSSQALLPSVCFAFLKIHANLFSCNYERLWRRRKLRPCPLV